MKSSTNKTSFFASIRSTLARWRQPGWRGAPYYFAFWAAMGVALPFLNNHFHRLGLSGFQIGILSAISPLMTLVGGPTISYVADRRQWQKRILFWTLAGLGVGFFLLRYPQTFAGLLPLMALVAAIRSPITPIADSLIARSASRHQVDFGDLRLWGSLSFALASLIGGALWDRLGFDPMFIAAALGLLPAMYLSTKLEKTNVPLTYTPQSIHQVRQDTGLLALLAASFLIGASEGMYVTFSGVYMDQLGGGQIMTGALFGMAALSEIPVMRASGAISRKLGRSQMVLLGYGLIAIALFGYAAVQVPGILVLFAMLKGMGFALYLVGSVSLIDARAPEAWASTLQSLMTAASWGLAPLITTPLAGWLSDSLGLPALFAIAGGLAALAVVLLGVPTLGGLMDEKPLLENAASD